MAFHLSPMLMCPKDAPLDDPRRQGDYERAILDEWPGLIGETIITAARAARDPVTTLLFYLVDHSNQIKYRQMRTKGEPDYWERDDGSRVLAPLDTERPE